MARPPHAVAPAVHGDAGAFTSGLAAPTLLVIASLALASCRPALAPPAALSAPQAASRVLVDDTGARVDVPLAPQRIACLAPDLAQLAFDVGAGARVVGVTAECDKPDAVRLLPRLGTLVQPSTELIVLARPDLVLATSQGNPRDVLERLRALGVPVFGIDARQGLPGVAREIRLVGTLCGRTDEGERLASAMERRLEAVRVAARGRPRVRTCCLVWTSPLIAAGDGTFLADLVDAAGGEDTCGGGRAEYPRLGREDLLAAAPDALLLATGDASSRKALDGWGDGLPAVRTGRVFDLAPAELYLRPTGGLAEAAEKLAELLATPPRAAAPEGR